MSFLQGQDKQFLEMGEMAGYGQFGVVLDRFPTRIGVGYVACGTKS